MTKYDKERSDKVVKFLDAVVELSKQHGLSLSHEDGHGGFLVQPADQSNYRWLLAAADESGEQE